MQSSGRFRRGRHINESHATVEVPRVAGGCVACGHQSLVLVGNGILCDRPECPDQRATESLLMAPVVLDHLIAVTEDSFSILHPLTERVQDPLFNCSFHRDIVALTEPPAPPGIYQVTTNDEGQWEFILIRPSGD